MDVEKLRNQFSRGAKARAALDNEIISQAFEDVEKGIHTAWAESDPFDVQLQTTLRVKLMGLKDVRERLGYYISSGKAAEAKLSDKR